MEYIVDWGGLAADVTVIAGRYCYPEFKRMLKPRRGERIVRCSDCAKTDVLPDGRIVCKRFGADYHVEPPEGYCHEGEARA